MLMY